MPRLLTALLIFSVAALCLSNGSANAQESKLKCPECKEGQALPAVQTADSRSFEFEWPGLDFQIEFNIAAAQDENPTASAQKNTDSHCECERDAGIPFLSDLQGIGKLFKNVGISSDCICGRCAVASTEPPTPATVRQAPQQYPHEIQLVTHEVYVDGDHAPQHSTISEETVELRIRNERLQMEVETAEQRLEMMETVMELRLEMMVAVMELREEATEQRLKSIEAVIELREENAVLKTRIQFFESHQGHAPRRDVRTHEQH